MWICPYCREPMPLTWKRHLLTNTSRNRCTRCGRISRLSSSSSNVLVAVALVTLPGWILGGIIGLQFGIAAMAAGFLMGGFATMLVITKYSDQRYRQLVPIEGPVGTDSICVECAGVFSPDQLITHGQHHVCARCKPVFLQKLAEGAVIALQPSRKIPFVLTQPGLVVLLAIIAVIGVLLAFLIPNIWL